MPNSPVSPSMSAYQRRVRSTSRVLKKMPPRPVICATAARSMDEAGDDVAVAAADLHLAPGIQHQKAFAVGVRLDLADEIEVDDGRAVDALEAARVEALLEILHRLAQDQRVVAGVDAHIVAGGVDLLDRVDIDAEDLAAILDVDQLLVPVRGVRVLALDTPDRIRSHFGEHFLELARFLDAAFLGQPLAHSLERVGEAFLLDRLHQIIDRLRLERAQRVVGISSHEDEKRRLDLHQSLDDGEAVETRHLDVEEDEIGFVGLDRTDRLAAVAAGVDDLDVLMLFQPELQPLDGKRLVVDQYGTDGHL